MTTIVATLQHHCDISLRYDARRRDNESQVHIPLSNEWVSLFWTYEIHEIEKCEYLAFKFRRNHATDKETKRICEAETVPIFIVSL